MKRLNTLDPKTGLNKRTENRQCSCVDFEREFEKVNKIEKPTDQKKEPKTLKAVTRRNPARKCKK